MKQAASSSRLKPGVRVGLQLAVAVEQVPRELLIDEWVNAAYALSGAGSPVEQSVTIRLVDEAESRQLNETFRFKDCPTNVLSFPGTVGEAAFEAAGDVELGDIVICLPLVKKEAAEQCKLVAAHVAHLIVHGLLHLLGFGHDNAEQARVMEALEARVLRQAGFPDPYLEASMPVQR